jgi:hypothetical protein
VSAPGSSAGARKLHDGSRARGQPAPARVVRHSLWRGLDAVLLEHLADALLAAPGARFLLPLGEVLVPRLAPREPRPPDKARERSIVDERVRALRVGGREHQAHRAAFGDAAEDGSLAARRVHHRADVVHTRLEVRDPRDAVGEARAALVEQDQPRERREPEVEARDRGLVPRQLDIGERPRRPDEVERAIPDRLERDRDVAALRVPCLGRLHADSFRPRAGLGKWPGG